MKKLLIVITALGLTLFAAGQDPVFRWGELIQKEETGVKYEEVKIYGGNADGFFVVSSHMPDFDDHRITISQFNPIITAEYFDKLFRKSFTRNITPARADDHVATVYFNNALYEITANFNKDEGKNTLLARGITARGNETKPVLLGKISGPKMSQRGKFEVGVSPDGNKLIVLAQEEYVKDQNEKFTLTLFDKNFVQVWDKTLNFDFPWSKNAANKPYVNNAGTVFIYKEIDQKGADDRWSVFSYNGTALKEHKIFGEPEKRMTSTVQAFSPEGDFVFAGYYGNGKKFRIDIGAPVIGDFVYRISADGQQMKTAAVNAFDTRKGLMMKDLVFSGKNIILLGEKYSVSDKPAARQAGAPTQSMFVRDYTYDSGEMFFDGLDETGKPLYASSLSKDVSTTNDLGFRGGVLPAVVNGKFHLLFNDYKSRYGTRWVVINPPYVIVHNTMDALTGAMQKAMYVEDPGPVGDKKGDSDLRPASYYRLDDTHYIVRAESGNQVRMGIVSF